VSRLPVMGKKICLVLGHVLMLYITWLVFSGSLAQVKINWEVEAPVTGASVGIFYSAGVVFAVSAGVLLLRGLWRVLSGQISEDELVMVKESEEAGELEELQAQLAKENAELPATIDTHSGRKS
jgi:TRAP-type C4-dicarboxylate transport system permease small subunit